MKIYLSELKKIDWLFPYLPLNFRELKSGLSYTFSYSYNYDIGGLNISNTEVSSVINDAIYKKQVDEHMAFLKEPFDSDSTIFYYFLLTYILESGENVERLKKLFLIWKQRDVQELKNQTKEEKNGSFKITNLTTLETALRRFIINSDYVESALKVSELFNGYFENRFGKSFYGNYLTKIVRTMPNPVGGFIPEENGEMRYMMVGEKALLSESERTELERAKDLFRKKVDLKKIWYDTGWFLNEYDGRWRKRISDEDFSIKINQLSDFDGSKIFIPKDYKGNIANVLLATSDSDIRQGLLANGYSGKIDDVIHHPELFKRYPELKALPFFFGLLRDDVIAEIKRNCFYDPEDKVIVIGAMLSRSGDERTIIHEMQHYVQERENFARGGSDFIADIVNNVGGKYVREFFMNTNNVGKVFLEKSSSVNPESITTFLMQLLEKVKLIQHVNKFGFTTNKMYSAKAQLFNASKSIFSACRNEKEWSVKADIVGKYLLHFYSSCLFELDEILSNSILSFIKNDLGLSEVEEFFAGNRKIQQDSFQGKEALMKKGWSDTELYNIGFNMYKGLFGEVESRDVKQLSKLPKELEDYLAPYTSETIEKKYLNVYFDESMPPEQANYKAAVENYGGEKYIIHLNAFGFSTYYLHELGHILYDFVKELPIMAQMRLEYLKSGSSFDSLEHYFIEQFFSYLYRKDIDKELTDLLKQTKFIRNQTYHSLFEEIFFSKEQIKKTENIKLTIEEGLKYIDEFEK